jgi:hypothetical protein
MILLMFACTFAAIADPPADYGDWEVLAQRIQQLDESGELIDIQPIITVPEEVVEPEAPIQDEIPEEEPPATEG